MTTVATRALREPLFQFLLIGLALFGLNALAPVATSDGAAPDQDPRRIHVDADVLRDLADGFERARGAPPNDEELDALVTRYVDDEALYREARALMLDHGDELIRARLRTLMRTLLMRGLVVDDPAPETLRAWFEARRADYAEPARISLRLLGVEGGAVEAAALADALNAAGGAGRGDVAAAQGRRSLDFIDRPRAELVGFFGEAFVAAIEAAPAAAWVPVAAPQGRGVATRLDAKAAVARRFDDVRDRVLDDWRRAQINQ